MALVCELLTPTPPAIAPTVFAETWFIGALPATTWQPESYFTETGAPAESWPESSFVPVAPVSEIVSAETVPPEPVLAATAADMVAAPAGDSAPAAPATLVLPSPLKRGRDGPLVTVANTAVQPAAPPRGRRLHLTPLWEMLAERLEFDFSPSTLWRLLDEHALRPWRTRYWIFPRDPRFVELASPVLDLYAGLWQGEPLGPKDYVLSLDEKTSIQSRVRLHPTIAAAPGRPTLVEFEYARGGALQYLTAWDVHRARVYGRCEAQTGIAPFGRLVDQVMSQEPYCSADRVFGIVDNGSSHRGAASVRRLRARYANFTLLHLPVHASWLNQVEIYYSIVQRVVLQPNDFLSLADVRLALAEFEARYNRDAQPFDWRFGRSELTALVEKLRTYPLPSAKPKRRTRKTKVPMNH